MRVLVGSDATVTSPTFVGADGETPTATAVLPTVEVTRWDGTAITPALVPVAATAGTYTITLTAAHTAVLDNLTVVWTGTAGGRVQRDTQAVEVVGGVYATAPRLRSVRGLDSVSTFPLARLLELRDGFEDLAEEYRGVAFVPRLAVERLRGNSDTTILLDHPQARALRSVSVDGVAVGDLTGYSVAPHGALIGPTWPAPTGWIRNVVVAYEHGYDRPPDALRRACREYVRAVAKQEASGMGRDMLSQQTDVGVVRYSTPDMAAGRPTGYVEVDRLLNSVPDERVPAFA